MTHSLRAEAAMAFFFGSPLEEGTAVHRSVPADLRQGPVGTPDADAAPNGGQGGPPTAWPPTTTAIFVRGDVAGRGDRNER